MDDLINDSPKKVYPLSITLGSKTFKLKIRVKTLVIILCVLAIVGLAYYYKSLLVAATVNGSPISRLSLISELEKSGAKQTLEAMINKKLVGMEAAKKGITASDDEIQAEIAKAETTVKAQGGTLEAALTAQGLTLTDLKQELAMQVKLRKMLADKTQVTDADIDAYIKTSGLTMPKDEAALTQERSQISDQLAQQKFSTEAQTFIKSLRAAARINYFANY
ncbi:MAG: SurA N-terminal domain-containing protein [bacterium]|nr:SurA N-terminal domain-containing protein [bacterium]